MNNYYNPYRGLDQSVQQLQGLMNQYQQLSNQQYNTQVANTPMVGQAMSNQGRWYYVSSYNEVATTPTPQDGNATLFVNLDKGVLWSKKFINGSNSIQAFSIQPLNEVGNVNEQPIESTQIETILNELNTINERLGKLENVNIRKNANVKSTNKTIDE